MADRLTKSRMAPLRVVGGAVLAALILLLGRSLTSHREQIVTVHAGIEPALASENPFSVPQPGDPEYDDYRKMLAHPKYRSSLENTPGYALPYDPEWRAVVRGRREVGPTDQVFQLGLVSLDALAVSYLDGLAGEDGNMLFDLAVTPEEFKGILWPEFPQSRPFLRIPPDEAWMFQITHLSDDLGSQVGRLGGVKRKLIGVTPGSVQEFTNFRILEDVVITAREVETGKEAQLKLEAVAERKGRFKVYTVGRS